MRYDLEKLKNSIPLTDYYKEVLGEPKASRNGHNVYLCPFHNDTNEPNLNVSKEYGSYTCFACGEKGDILKFHQKTHGLTFPDACGNLAQKYNIDCAIASPKQAVVKPLPITHDLPQDALGYLHGRGLTDETIKRSWPWPYR